MNIIPFGKAVLKALGILLLVAVLCIGGFVGCMLLVAGDVSKDEIARKVSPDLRLDAVLVETNGGATTPFGYLVFIVPVGKPFPRNLKNDVFAAYHLQNIRLSWPDSSTLEIRYDRYDRDAYYRAPTILGVKEIVKARDGTGSYRNVKVRLIHPPEQ